MPPSGEMRTVRLGRILGNWNDSTRKGRRDTRAERGLRWRAIDRLAGWLFTRGKS